MGLAMRCIITPIALYKLDVECDKRATFVDNTWRRWTCHGCFKPIVLYTKVDGQFDKVAIVVSRPLTGLATDRGEVFRSPKFETKFQGEGGLITLCWKSPNFFKTQCRISRAAKSVCQKPARSVQPFWYRHA